MDPRMDHFASLDDAFDAKTWRTDNEPQEATQLSEILTRPSLYFSIALLLFGSLVFTAQPESVRISSEHSQAEATSDFLSSEPSSRQDQQSVQAVSDVKDAAVKL